MEAAKAQELLGKLRGLKKTANVDTGLFIDMPINTVLNTVAKPLYEKAKNLTQGNIYPDVAKQQAYDDLLASEAKQKILKVLGLSLGAGAAIRGFHGLRDTLQNPEVKIPSKIIDLPVPENKKLKKEAYTSIYDVPGFIPAMLLGSPLAVYGGWRGVDALLDRQKRKQLEHELDTAKTKYEDSLLQGYKTAVDKNLNTAARLLEKSATLPLAKSLGLTYALGAFPLGYYFTDKYMRKHSQRELLNQVLKQKSLQESAAQPPEIFANLIPEQVEEKEQD
jgi:hypothetical protein